MYGVVLSSVFECWIAPGSVRSKCVKRNGVGRGAWVKMWLFLLEKERRGKTFSASRSFKKNMERGSHLELPVYENCGFRVNAQATQFFCGHEFSLIIFSFRTRELTYHFKAASRLRGQCFVGSAETWTPPEKWTFLADKNWSIHSVFLRRKISNKRSCLCRDLMQWKHKPHYDCKIILGKPLNPKDTGKPDSFLPQHKAPKC